VELASACKNILLQQKELSAACGSHRKNIEEQSGAWAFKTFQAQCPCFLCPSGSGGAVGHNLLLQRLLDSVSIPLQAGVDALLQVPGFT
jgi:hypothetical protein